MAVFFDKTCKGRLKNPISSAPFFSHTECYPMNESIKNKLHGLLVLAVAALFGWMGWQ
ncbi:hypothetical protein [Neisseria bacilliformis]|uniref:hypothetical protein n=1 Tax=Neisseria bacilliformis TaxID=267212 RepID=UPI000AEAA7A7|nr:hypothetical protein [Neisseria bacilliformis]